MYALCYNRKPIGHESTDCEFIIHQALKCGAIFNVWNNNGTMEYSAFKGYTIEEVKEQCR